MSDFDYLGTVDDEMEFCTDEILHDGFEHRAMDGLLTDEVVMEWLLDLEAGNDHAPQSNVRALVQRELRA